MTVSSVTQKSRANGGMCCDRILFRIFDNSNKVMQLLLLKVLCNMLRPHGSEFEMSWMSLHSPENENDETFPHFRQHLTTSWKLVSFFDRE